MRRVGDFSRVRGCVFLLSAWSLLWHELSNARQLSVLSEQVFELKKAAGEVGEVPIPMLPPGLSTPPPSIGIVSYCIAAGQHTLKIFLPSAKYSFAVRVKLEHLVQTLIIWPCFV